MRFSTNLNCANCVASLAPVLDGDPRVHRWSIDTSDPLKVLMVEGDNLSAQWVRTIVSEAGFEVYLQLDDRENNSPSQSAAGSVVTADEKQADAPRQADAQSQSKLSRSKPLLLLFLYLAAVVCFVQWKAREWDTEMAITQLMGGFFLVFSFFKMLDLSGFANAFSMYDVVARRIPLYAWAYPFFELSLGFGYLARWPEPWIHWVTLTVMAIGLVGGLQMMSRGQSVRGNCLGTVFNLPMSFASTIQNGMMALLSAAILIRGL